MKDKSGLTVEGLQEYYDEACLAVLNNRFAKYIFVQIWKSISWIVTCICLNCKNCIGKDYLLIDFHLSENLLTVLFIKGTKMGFSGMMCHASSGPLSSVRWGSLTFSSEISYLSCDSLESFIFGFNLYHLWDGPLEIYTVSSHLILYNGCHCRTQMFRWLEWSAREGWMSAGQPLDC